MHRKQTFVELLDLPRKVPGVGGALPDPVVSLHGDVDLFLLDILVV